MSKHYFCALAEATASEAAADHREGNRHAILVYVDCDDADGPLKVVRGLEERGWRDVVVKRTKRAIDAGNFAPDDPVKLALDEVAASGFGAVIYSDPVRPS